MQPIIIFGAGKFGKMALHEYAERVAYFADNNTDLVGKTVEGITVISLKELVEIKEDYEIVIATKYSDSVIKQFKAEGIEKYRIYLSDSRMYYPTNDLIYNPYLENSNYIEYSDEKNEIKIQEINDLVDKVYGVQQLFEHVEIETVNRCNGNCDFCPVSIKNDSRDYKVMDRQLFESIINQLSELNYSGKLALFSNNEPFLDPDIIDKHRYARMKLPSARMHLFTNGTLLTLDKFVEIMQYLDELIIDNYQQELKLIKPCLAIQEYCLEHPELKSRVTIVLRKPHEILSSRGGDAPNKKEVKSYPHAKCVLPFKQLIIRPDGKVSLCCNDPLGRNTLGDVSKQSLTEVWYNDRFKMVRECLNKGRGHWNHCIYCDAFGIG